jgi:hypothetical protein
MEQHDTATTLTDQQILDTVRQTIALFRQNVEDGHADLTTGDLIRMLELEAVLSRRRETSKIMITWADPDDWQEEPGAA